MKRFEFTINAKKEDNIMYHFFPIEVGEDIGRIECFYDFYPKPSRAKCGKTKSAFASKTLAV